MFKLFSTPLGRFRVDTEKDRKFAKMLEAEDYSQSDEVHSMLRFITGESVVADIGAHIGITSVPLARVAKFVHSFEPLAENAATLRENILLNDLHNVEVHQIGLSDTKTTASATVTNHKNNATSMLREGGEIPVMTLDQALGGERVDFIKIDTEGMEPYVLDGAHETTARWRPYFFFEVNLTGLRMQGTALSRISAFMRKHRYALYLQDGQNLLPLFNLSLAAALLEPRMFFFGIHSGVFNVFAAPKERPLPVEIASGPLLAFGRMLLALCKRALKDREWLIPAVAIVLFFCLAAFLKTQCHCPVVQSYCC